MRELTGEAIDIIRDAFENLDYGSIQIMKGSENFVDIVVTQRIRVQDGTPYPGKIEESPRKTYIVKRRS